MMAVRHPTYPRRAHTLVEMREWTVPHDDGQSKKGSVHDDQRDAHAAAANAGAENCRITVENAQSRIFSAAKVLVGDTTLRRGRTDSAVRVVNGATLSTGEEQRKKQRPPAPPHDAPRLA